MKLRSTITLISLFVLILAGVPFISGQNAPLTGFDDYVNKAIRDWEVPGVAIAIVKDDKVILAKGYGVKRLGAPAPVDERTVFAIGSSSKAFTAATIALLVDEGKLKWDDPVIKFLPGFQTADPYVTRELTIRDLLSHRAGLERGELLWSASEYDREELIRRARFLKSAASLRGNFVYQNVMYLAAGEVAAKAAGKSWDDLIAERIFGPLGMTASSTSIKAFKPTDNTASPHAKSGDKIEPIAWRDVDNIGPAGSINSSAIDMANWVRLQLGQGSFEGKKIFSPAIAREMHMSQIVMRPDGGSALMYPEANFLNYGLGWFLSDYKGRKLVEHGGSIDGMRAQVAMVPEEKLGIVILTNMNGSILPVPLMYRIIDAYLGVPQKDWAGDFLKRIKAATEQGKEAEKRAEASRVKDTRPTLAIENYAGTYSNDLYGNVIVTNSDGKLNLRFGPAFVSDLEHWHYDTFRAIFQNAVIPTGSMTFALNGLGKVDTVTLNMPGMSDYPFKRVAGAAPTAAAVSAAGADLRKFVGKWALAEPPLEVTTDVVGGELNLNIPGQPAYTLVFVSENMFAIKDAPSGYFTQFNVADGKIVSLTLIQGTVSYTLLSKQ